MSEGLPPFKAVRVGIYDPETKETEFIGPAIEYRTMDIPVIDGIATLPNGSTVRSTSKVVRVPYLTPEDKERLAAMLPAYDEDEDCWDLD